MAEVILEGRGHLTSAQMGSGYEKYDDPEKSLDFLCASYRMLRDMVAINYGYANGKEELLDLDLAARFRTATLDMAWLGGDLELVQELLKREVLLDELI